MKLSRISIIIYAAFALVGCSDTPTVNLGIDDTYIIHRMQKLPLHSALTGNEYRWSLIEDESSTILGTDQDFIFIAQHEGTYHLRVEIIDSETPFHHDFTITVLREEIEYSPYISKVYEYRPAPGQFVNELPPYSEGDTEADMARKAEEYISGTNNGIITLGGFGGYVTFGFDHTIINVEGEPDFRIWGNCVYEQQVQDRPGGSAEPGIVMVSFDTNCNGIPDDQWYELAGSEYTNPDTKHGYTITYSRPEPGHAIESDRSGMLNDLKYIHWTDSYGGDGYIARNIFHAQEYYPEWIKEDQLSFSGSCLPQNGFDRSSNGSYYILYSFERGYVDNHPNDYAELNSFDISDAVDQDGNPVRLPGIDFVRVYTGVNQYCGWLGETSTEISKAADLHL